MYLFRKEAHATCTSMLYIFWNYQIYNQATKHDIDVRFLNVCEALKEIAI